MAPIHHYGFNQVNLAGKLPISGKVRIHKWPGSGNTLSSTAPYFITTATRDKEWAWKLLRYLGGRTQDGAYTQATNLMRNAMLGSGFKTVMESQNLRETWGQWGDVDDLLDSWGKATSVNDFMPVYSERRYTPWFNAMVKDAQKVLTGEQTADVACGTLSAHALVRLRPRWGLWLLQLNVAARFLPILVLVIPLYILLRKVGLLNSLTGVVITEVGLLVPFAFVILVPFFESQPNDMEEAARLDGCTRFGAFMRVALPLAAPGLAACGTIVFIVSWHELIIPLVLTTRPEMMTLPAILSSLVGEWVFLNLIMATALMALLPSVVLVLLLQKYVVAGLSGGALKG